MQDIINSFKAHLYDRTSSPIVGAFIFYWLVCNYKMVVVLFDSTLNSEGKFKAIELLYKDDFISIFSWLDIPIIGFLLPTIITLVYILIFPFISNMIYKGWVWHQNELKRISNDKVYTKKEFANLQQRFSDLELSFNNMFSKKDDEIIRLKEILQKKENELEQINYEMQRKQYIHKTEDASFEDKVLIMIGERVTVFPDEIGKEFNIHTTRIKETLQTLIDNNLIEVEKGTMRNNENPFKLTEKGEQYLLKNNLV